MCAALHLKPVAPLREYKRLGGLGARGFRVKFPSRPGPDSESPPARLLQKGGPELGPAQPRAPARTRPKASDECCWRSAYWRADWEECQLRGTRKCHRHLNCERSSHHDAAALPMPVAASSSTENDPRSASGTSFRTSSATTCSASPMRSSPPPHAHSTQQRVPAERIAAACRVVRGGAH